MLTLCLKGTNTQHSGHMAQNVQTEFMVEIYSNSQLELTHQMKLKYQLESIKVMKNGLCKKNCCFGGTHKKHCTMIMMFRLVAIFLTLYFSTYLSWPDWLYF